MNKRTQALLRVVGEGYDSHGAVVLSRLIGRYGIRDAFDLDEYALSEDFSKVGRAKKQVATAGTGKPLELKSELASYANLAASRLKITKLHNKLTNRLRDYLLWRRLVSKEARFDVLIQDWNEGRQLLIEAKTAFEGPGGRAQVRQAIGQLFDYRFTYLSTEKTDLAVLFPTEPSADVKSLLKSLDIEVLWFRAKRVCGTVNL